MLFGFLTLSVVHNASLDTYLTFLTTAHILVFYPLYNLISAFTSAFPFVYILEGYPIPNYSSLHIFLALLGDIGEG